MLIAARNSSKARMGQVRLKNYVLVTEGHQSNVRNFLKILSYLKMVLYKNERLPSNPHMQVKTFSLFQSKFSLWLAKDSIMEGLQ